MRRRFVITAIISILLSLALGYIDYETHTIAGLFAAQNIPALLFFAAGFFVLFNLVRLIPFLWRSVRRD